MAFCFTDMDGIRWKVWVRGWYTHIITGARTLKAFKQKAANERRELGYENHALAIEKQTIMRWSKDSGIFSKSIRIVNGREVK